jgi:hypothetical protein
MPTGFMSERTAEYVLVPDLIRQLGNFCPQVTPFFFWASREGQAKAHASYDGRLRLLGAYARRPKVSYAGAKTIYIKFNALLFYHAFQLKQAGIPLLAGVPCVSRLSDLHLNASCAWFHVNPESKEWRDTVAKIDLDEPEHAMLPDSESMVHGPLRTEDVKQLVLEYSQVLLWPEALDKLHEANRNLLRGPYADIAWYGKYLPYKPFYLAMIERD